MSERGRRFLHIADIHLGCRHFNSRERERDFYLAFRSIIDRYVLPEREDDPPQVDFVLIAGDLFDSRNIHPQTLSRSTDVLSDLRDYNVPVFAIEGNHDARRRGEWGLANWYDYLAGEGFLIHLRDRPDPDLSRDLIPWNPEDRAGSYYDFDDGLRIVGTRWYGATAHTMIKRLAENLAHLPPASSTILLFHGGLSGYINELSAGVEYEEILPLRPYVDYLALGHVHKQYSRDGWLFNPGCLEAATVREALEEHGAYLVEQAPDGKFVPLHLTDYRRRPFIRLHLLCDTLETSADLTEAVQEQVKSRGVSERQRIHEERPPGIEPVDPVVQIDLLGSLGFPLSRMEVRDLELWVKETLDAELVRIRNESTPIEYGVEDLPEEDGRIDRQALERVIFQGLIAQDTRYREKSSELAALAAEIKDMAVDGLSPEENEEIFQRIARLFPSLPFQA